MSFKKLLHLVVQVSFLKIDFKTMLKQDFSTFINLDEFGERAVVDGIEIDVMFDRDTFRDRRASSVKIIDDGIQNLEESLFCREDDLGYRPYKGQTLTVNDEWFIVKNCISNGGMLEIVLEVHIG